MNRKIVAALLAAALGVTAAHAEVLDITGEFAAPNREASLLHSISIDRISGQDGPALGRAIEQGLAGTHFELLGGGMGRNRAEGSLSGGVTTGVEENSFKKTEKKCVEKDKDGKCTREDNVDTMCRRRVINVNVDLRLIRNRDGRIVYSASKPFRDEVSWCAGQNPPSTVEDTVSDAVRSIGMSVRRDIAPSRESYRIRVRESTKGMSKEQAQRFKDLIKLTKRDQRGACTGWDAMRPDLGAHPSLLFDLGLCAEQSGDYEAALNFYRQAASAGAGEGNEGAGRAQRLIAGREDATIRARTRR
jgi:hypothetical protein